MPFKISKEEAKTRSQLIEDLELAATEIDQCVDVYNTQVNLLRTPVEVAVTKYNELVAKARDFCSSISNQAELDLGDKSEKWMEGEKGQAAQSFQESWGGIELDDLDFQWPDELEIDIDNHADDLKDLPEEADEL
jgi:hypothetical protein